MKNSFLKICSMLLVLILLANMLPLQVFAQQLNIGKRETVSTAPELTEGETATDRVIAEIKEKRTEFSKEFLLSSGLHMITVYPEAVHYAANTGWEEIDNTLVAKSDGMITNTAGVWDVSFPQQLSKDKSVTIEKDGHTLSFSMAGELTAGNAVIRAIGSTQEETLTTSNMRLSTATTKMPDLTKMRASVKYEEMVPEKVQSQLTYANVYQNTDIVYDLASNRVKESVVLESYRSNLRGYRYTLDVGEMIPVLEENGQILFYDAKGENVVMVMPAPYMIDDAGVRSDDVRVQLTGSGSRYTMTYLLPQQWLAAEDRAWPVILDPAVHPSLSVANIWDRTVAEYKEHLRIAPDNVCGYTWDGGITRFYLLYNNLPQLTSSDVIVNATLHMSVANGTDSTMPVYVHKVNSFWMPSEITWGNQPNYEPVAEDYAMTLLGGSYTWDITDIVQGWYAGENTGMMFKAGDNIEDVPTNNYKTFPSSECGTELSWPIFSLTIRNNNGLESYWDYTSASAGRAGTGYVNNYTGNLVWVRNDIGFGGNRMPVSINHIYNANDAQYFQDTEGNYNNSNDTAGNNFGLGNGWRTNYNQLIYQWNVDDDYYIDPYYIWEDADGTDHYFWKESENTYKDEDGLGLTLTVMQIASETEEYLLTDKNGNLSYFDSYGRLARLENNQRTQSCVEIVYIVGTKRINYILDGVGRKYDFEYNDANLLTAINYKGSGAEVISHVSFLYDTDNNLTRVTDKDGQYSTYAYNIVTETEERVRNLLQSVHDVDGYELFYTHSPGTLGKPARVSSVIPIHNNQLGNRLTFDYGNNLTKLTSYDNTNNVQSVQMMQFNDMGNTICVQDDEGRAQYVQFAKNDPKDKVNKANQLQLSSKLQDTVVNFFNNSSFENGAAWTSLTDGANVCVVDTDAYYGSHAMQISAADTACVSDENAYSVEPGQSVTFSAYIKAEETVVWLSLDDGLKQYDSEVIECGSGWIRLETTYTNTTANTKEISPYIQTPISGIFLVDNVQLEYTSTASRYNLINNGDFQHGANGWSGNFQIADPPAPSDANAPKQPPQLSGKAVRIVGDPTAQKRVSQTIAVSGNANDSFVYAAWGKGDSASLWKRQYEDYNRTFAMEIQFHHTDGTVSDIFSTQFNPDTEQWQYIANAAVVLKAYSAVTITLCYDYNINTVYFDGIQLFKEEFGTSYTYDDEGNVISVVDLQKQKTEYVYDEPTHTNLLQIIEDNKAKMTYEYDIYHNVTKATSDTGIVYNFTYDDYGNNLSVSVTSGDTTITTLSHYTDDGNRLDFTVDALGKKTEYGYNADTNVLEWVQDPEDTAATRTTYTYDEMYRVASVSTPRDAENTLSASYTYYDDLLYYLYTESTAYRFSYGNFGLRTGVYAGETTLAHYTYTTDGNNYLSALDYGNGDSVEYNYDDKGRLTLETFEDGDAVAYTYNNYGNLATVTDTATGITTTYYYDLLDRMVKYRETANGLDHSVTYAYDGHNNLSSLTEKISGLEYTTEYAYDEDNRVTSVSSGSATETYNYDGLGRMDRITTVSDGETVLTREYTFTATQIATNHIQATVGTGTGATGYDDPDPYTYGVTYSYTYDDNGNILSISDGTYTTSYAYDSANQLIRENNQELGFTRTWAYDNAGNILCRREYAYTTGSLENLVPVEVHEMSGYGMYGIGDLFAEYDGQVMSYDAIGNPLYDGQWTYTWEHGRELSAMSDGGYNNWTFTYDANGMRTQRTDGYYTYWYIYNGSQLSQLIVVYDDGEHYEYHRLNFAYSADGTPLAVIYNDCTYYYVTNIQGDVIAILDDIGRLVCRYAYDAWGNVTICDERPDNVSWYNPLRYRGYVYDWETNLYYLQSRYYSPKWGRFLNADALISTGQGPIGNNMFAYCGNNPVIRADTSGNIFFTVLGAVIGGICGAVDSMLMGGDVAKGALAGAVSGAISGAGVDIGVAITAATGGAGAGVGVAIAGAMGAAGAIVGTGISTDWEADALDYAASAVVGGATNIISFGLAPINGEIGKGAAKIISGLVEEGVKDLAMNVATGGIVAAGATWINRVITNNNQRTRERATFK